jgi:hypothetical protein
MKTKLIITGIALVAVNAWATGQNNKTGNKQDGTKNCSDYVDNNKNGICDNHENTTAKMSGNKGKNKCDGQGYGRYKGKCKHYVDTNKNGVCDNSEAKQK